MWHRIINLKIIPGKIIPTACFLWGFPVDSAVQKNLCHLPGFTWAKAFKWFLLSPSIEGTNPVFRLKDHVPTSCSSCHLYLECCARQKDVWVMPQTVSQRKERGKGMDVRKKPPQNKGVLWNKHPQQDWDVISPMKNPLKSPCEHSTVNSLYGKSVQC